MKKIFTVLVAAVVIMTACVSCNKEKVEDEKLPNLVGTWTGETISIWLEERDLTYARYLNFI